ncbi:response regulator transcription factor [Cognatishimia sp. MH4019]|uniref:response regulator transcription factor n=1 Tax=Cognatishimia sp. MH4019 TaxID=2854030 RepID=UPI001CD1FFD6|nr:response regulator transcription factor [Cognatishimia sp. MH4019]
MTTSPISIGEASKIDVILSTTNTFEEIGLKSVVTQLGWRNVTQSDRVPREDTIAIVSVTSQQMTNSALAAILSRFAPARVVLLVPSMANFFLFLKCPKSVVSILQRDADMDHLRTTLDFIGMGHTLLPWGNSDCQPCVSQSEPPDSVQEEWHLTDREVEISREIAVGRSNKEIARELGIAANTVDVHVSAIRRKLGVHNRTQIAVKIVEKMGQTPPSQLLA